METWSAAKCRLINLAGTIGHRLEQIHTQAELQQLLSHLIAVSCAEAYFALAS